MQHKLSVGVIHRAGDLRRKRRPVREVQSRDLLSHLLGQELHEVRSVRRRGINLHRQHRVREIKHGSGNRALNIRPGETRLLRRDALGGGLEWPGEAHRLLAEARQVRLALQRFALHGPRQASLFLADVSARKALRRGVSSDQLPILRAQQEPAKLGQVHPFGRGCGVQPTVLGIVRDAGHRVREQSAFGSRAQLPSDDSSVVGLQGPADIGQLREGRAPRLAHRYVLQRQAGESQLAVLTRADRDAGVFQPQGVEGLVGGPPFCESSQIVAGIHFGGPREARPVGSEAAQVSRPDVLDQVCLELSRVPALPRPRLQLPPQTALRFDPGILARSQQALGQHVTLERGKPQRQGLVVAEQALVLQHQVHVAHDEPGSEMPGEARQDWLCNLLAAARAQGQELRGDDPACGIPLHGA